MVPNIIRHLHDIAAYLSYWKSLSLSISYSSNIDFKKINKTEQFSLILTTLFKKQWTWVGVFPSMSVLWVQQTKA